MTTAVAIFIGVVLLTLIATAISKRPYRQMIRIGRETGDFAPLVQHLETLPDARKMTAYDSVIGSFWRDYRRDLAAKLISLFVTEHAKTRLGQYWLKEIHSVEPELYAKHFEDGFYDDHYDAAIAATCGKFG